jgi:two-component sensor histidine kinase
MLVRRLVPSRVGWNEDRPRRHWGTADTVVAATAGLVVLIAAVFILLCIQGYGTTLAEAKSRAQRAAQAVAEGSHWTIAATMASLEVAGSELARGATIDEVAQKFGLASTNLPVPPTLSIYGADGELRWQSPGATAPQQLSSMAILDDIRDASAPILGYPEGQSRSFTVSKHIGPDGAFSGALVAELPTEVLYRFAVPHDLGQGSTVSVIRADGSIVARDPPLAAPLNLEGSNAWTELNKSNSGTYVSASSPADGIARIVGFERVTGLNYLAVASISETSVFAGLWYSIWVVSLLLAPIALVLLAGSFLTARVIRRAQANSASLAAALDRNEQLFREIHHRVKNNLQSVTALLQVHAIPRDVRADLTQRLFAMSAVHEHIYRTGNFADVRIKDYLHTLIENVKAGADPRIVVIDDLADVTVDKDAAAPLGLILNEVLSNCFKHAFPDGKAGTVTVSLKRVSDDSVELSVEDDGVGYNDSIPAKGIGRKLVAGFAKQLGGDFTFSSHGGSKFVLTFPGR